MKSIFKYYHEILDQQHEIQGAVIKKKFCTYKAYMRTKRFLFCDPSQRNKGELLISELFT